VSDVGEQLRWAVEDAQYIQTRSQRYAGALNVEPSWTQEAMEDPDLVAFEPDPKSRVGAARFIGESPTSGLLIVVIAYRDLDGVLHGVNAWPATGADRDAYERGDQDGERRSP
jgi:hypothetical protein